MNTRTLNLIDDHRRLHLQHSEDEPTFLYVLLFVEDRVLVCARVDLQQCRFSMSSAGPLFWVGEGTNFLITEQEGRHMKITNNGDEELYISEDTCGTHMDGYHRITAEYFGFPEWLERLRDAIFEGLPNDERRDFHVRLKEAIPVGVDIEPVRHRLAIRRLNRLIEAQEQALAEQKGELKSTIEQVVAALHQVRRCHEAEIGQGQCSVGDWSSARSSAWSAAWLAARLAELAAWPGESSLARSAELAARSAAWSAESSAAWSAAESAAESAESSAAWKREAADLIELLAQAG